MSPELGRDMLTPSTPASIAALPFELLTACLQSAVRVDRGDLAILPLACTNRSFRDAVQEVPASCCLLLLSLLFIHCRALSATPLLSMPGLYRWWTAPLSAGWPSTDAPW